MSHRAEDTTGASLPPSQRIAFLAKTLDLAETLLTVAQGTRNHWHAQYCRKAAHDFHANVSRILSQMQTADVTLAPVRGAALMLEKRLQSMPG